ncbi:type II toxin-antitoxin system Phd/YefM family antitoxin [Neisseria chenwenguii]|uniref:Antitoxin n=1 Tax=Neisseria chenwenguii TaxID=1853278 RepID=A0A220S2A8_9NEIS|nr:type II toxin-antitoxin system Phd/YefM family antitoxin [Neisseria chenwenguii]ASK27506.1 prevent-host-death protein [Neisseria chenwenguii]ROV55586.1 type II toxin-antitoxin system Phd/YefM family antitoxin [Neisseria chenwenguii]
MHTYSSREFNQRTSQAQKAAHSGPVFITNRGKPDLVLISHEEYLRLSGKFQSALDVLTNIEPDASEIELEIPPRSRAQRRPVEFD